MQRCVLLFWFIKNLFTLAKMLYSLNISMVFTLRLSNPRSLLSLLVAL